MLYHVGDTSHLFLREHTLAFFQDLCKSHDDIQRGADLVGYILYEQHLLVVGSLCQFTGANKLFIAPRCLSVHLLDIVDVTAERLLHRGERVLQATYNVVVWTDVNLFIIVSCCYLLNLSRQFVKRPDGMGYCEYAEQENQYQTNDYERRQDHGQTIVVPFRRD